MIFQHDNVFITALIVSVKLQIKLLMIGYIRNQGTIGQATNLRQTQMQSWREA